MLSLLRADLKKIADAKRAKIIARFFKTGKGEYAEGDVFLGISVPESRRIAIEYKDLPLPEIRELLKSKIHEERLIALLILVHNFRLGSDPERTKIFNYYLLHTKYINNWDLVDLSADKIIGEYLFGQNFPFIGSAAQFSLLINLADSKNLWERRIAMISTYAWIKRGEYKLTFEIAKKLIRDKHDLIQKAVGWMLREVGKRCSREIEEEFLARYYKKMGRTTLRYAIEHFDEKRRKKYLQGVA